MKRKIWLFGILFLTVGFHHQEASLANDFKMPDFKLYDLEGNLVSSSDFDGKVILLNFWATWCGPCKTEIPDLVKLYENYKDRGFAVVSIAISSGSANKVKKFAERWKMNYPILMGDARVVRAYGGIRGVPTTFVIDSKGNIQGAFLGPRPYKTFEKVISPLLPEAK